VTIGLCKQDGSVKLLGGEADMDRNGDRDSKKEEDAKGSFRWWPHFTEDGYMPFGYLRDVWPQLGRLIFTGGTRQKLFPYGHISIRDDRADADETYLPQ